MRWSSGPVVRGQGPANISWRFPSLTADTPSAGSSSRQYPATPLRRLSSSPEGWNPTTRCWRSSMTRGSFSWASRRTARTSSTANAHASHSGSSRSRASGCYHRGRLVGRVSRQGLGAGIGSDGTAEQALSGFTRFPQWMWRNEEVRDIVRWLRQHNDANIRAPRRSGR
ncbi:MAG: erythromycin esterase family protein [Gemmatimonadaceae bacterium]